MSEESSTGRTRLLGEAKAVGVGFEPTMPFRAYRISSQARSTALPPHQGEGKV